ncbi:hypothetical protein GW17_00058046 [Ensete ventricosum]|nr:hypothetical protein GW17_00058046 [Ensete ventricosum]
MSVSEAHRGYQEFARMAQGNDAIGSRRKFARRFVEGIGKLTENTKGDRRKEDRMTCLKIAEGCRSMREVSSSPKEDWKWMPVCLKKEDSKVDVGHWRRTTIKL